MKTLCLLFGLLCGFAIAAENDGSKKPPCDTPVPFACFVHEWEEEHNKGNIKHAFDYHTAGLDADYCKDLLAKCSKDKPCPENDIGQGDAAKGVYVNVGNAADGKGHMFSCNPTHLFCDENKQAGCFPIRKVKVLKDNKDENEPFAEIETITFPICRRGDSVDECKSLTDGRFCGQSDLADVLSGQKALPWTSMKEICTVVEAPLGGGMPYFHAEKLVEEANKLGEKAPVQLQAEESARSIWRYTGFPYYVVTSKKSNFLPFRFKDEEATQDCVPYDLKTSGCRALPICDNNGKETKQQYFIGNNQTAGKSSNYFVDTRTTTKCEIACGTWDDPRTKKCRVLDLENFPLYRQDSPPYASFLEEAENIKGHFAIYLEEPTTTTDASPTKARLRRGDKDADYKYPQPIDLNSVLDEELKRIINANYWLSSDSNPFFKQLNEMDETNKYIHTTVKLLKLNKCTDADDKNTLCNGDQAESSDSLPVWAIALIAIGGVCICCTFSLCIVVAIVVPTVIYSKRQAKKTAADVKNSTDAPKSQFPMDPAATPNPEEPAPDTSVAKSSAAEGEPVVEKSTAPPISQTSQAGTEVAA